MSQRFEGRNLEEALQGASAALGVERWQLTYHVLLEKRGFLGGVKRVVIEADVNDTASEPEVAPVAPSRTTAGRPPREREPRPRRDGGGRSRGGDRSSGRGRGRGRRSDSEIRSAEAETFIGDVPEQGPESEGAKSVREWCETLLRLAKLDVVIRTEENESQILLRLYGSDVRQLIDRQGELLDAIQVLANKALVGRRVEKDVELDCEQFKERRNAELVELAREAADNVRRGGKEEILKAMTPIERRIIHLSLQDDPDVTTESRGDGFFKRIAIVVRQSGSEDEAGLQEP